MSKLKKLTATMMAGAMFFTALVTANAKDLITTETTFTDPGEYIGTYFKGSDYGPNDKFIVTYEYTSVGTKTASAFQFLVFDSAWGGWDAYDVGVPTGATANTTYTAEVPVSAIEANLSTTNPIQGINFQSGDDVDGSTAVKLKKLEIVEGTRTFNPVEITGSWTKGTAGGLTTTSTDILLNANEWNVTVGGLYTDELELPTARVTVDYSANTDENNFIQAEVLVNGTPIVEQYVQPKNLPTVVTYTTHFEKGTEELLFAYDGGTITKIEIIDQNENSFSPKTNLTSDTITDAMGIAFNVGNSFDSTNNGISGETVWGNPVLTKDLFKAIKAAGFSTVRLPVTWIGNIDSNGIPTEEYLDRIEEVVNYALNYDLFVIINVHHDGSTNVPGQWINVGNSTVDLTKYQNLWNAIATRFASYDQHVIFESLNEVMEDGNYEPPKKDTTYTNINNLNQTFVNTVRSQGGNNATRFLIVPGYNTNIEATVMNYTTTNPNRFILPNYAGLSDQRIIVSVHFYDPYDFTLNETANESQLVWDDSAIYEELEKLSVFTENGIPVFVGEYGVIKREYINNFEEERQYYIQYVTKTMTDMDLIPAYWDNGHIGDKGFAIFSRYDNTPTPTGEGLLSAIFE